jgi:hypothetical protein
MSIIKLEPKNKRPDLVVEYEGKNYTLPGHISAAMLEDMIGVRARKGDDAFLRMFLRDVVPEDFKKVLPQEDIDQLAQVWMEHIKGPKDSSSDN